MSLQDIIQHIARRAEADAAFRRELESDPAAVVLRETGMTEAELLQLDGEMDEEALGSIAGGSVSWEAYVYYGWLQLQEALQQMKQNWKKQRALEDEICRDPRFVDECRHGRLFRPLPRD